MPVPHPDQQYIEALLQNNTSLLDEVYRRYAGKIKAMVLQNNGTESDAADLFQEALVSLYQKAAHNGFILTCPLDAFLYLICRNRWINELKKRKGTKVTFTDTEGYSQLKDEHLQQADELAVKKKRLSLLEEKIKMLGENCRKLLELSWAGRSMDEVAAMLGLSYGYARKKKSECLGRLTELVQASPDYKNLKW